jgi:hypothetical protein
MATPNLLKIFRQGRRARPLDMQPNGLRILGPWTRYSRRWPIRRGGPELMLEPNDNPAAKTFQKSVFEQGIPATSFGVEDIRREYERLKALGVVFSMEPTSLGPVTMAVFDDTCGNFIQIAQR